MHDPFSRPQYQIPDAAKPRADALEAVADALLDREIQADLSEFALESVRASWLWTIDDLIP